MTTAQLAPRATDHQGAGGAGQLAELVRWNLRERGRTALGVGAALLVVAVMIFAMFPAVKDSIGTLDLGSGVDNLLGGADFGTLPGWISGEMVSILLPFALLLLGGALGAGWLAGREEGGTAALLLSTSTSRRAVTTAAMVAATLLVGVATALSFAGFLLGDALIGEDLSTADVAAAHLHVGALGLFGASLGLATGAVTGRRTLSLAVVGGVGVLSFLVNGFAGTVPGLGWTENVSAFYWSIGHQPLTEGVRPLGLVVLLGATTALYSLALLAWDRRDLRV